jgi:hypothetical protein
MRRTSTLNKVVDILAPVKLSLCGGSKATHAIPCIPNIVHIHCFLRTLL